MDRLAQVIGLIDTYNSRDPNKVIIEGHPIPKEVLYSERMTNMLYDFIEDPAVELAIAARAQHVGRWEILRSEYPEGRKGYLQWRNMLKQHHAEICGNLMQEVGFTESDIGRVQFLIQKKSLKKDPDTQSLEDVICLVFLRYYAADFARKHPRAKLLEILQKTWRKMSAQGHTAAMEIDIPSSVKDLLREVV